MSSFNEDLSYALRNLKKRPGFVIISILTLALASGAAVSMFHVFYTILMKPLPYADAEKLCVVWEEATHYGFPLNAPAAANYLDWKKQNRSFSAMAAISTDRATLTGEGEPVQLQSASVSADIFPLLGLTRAYAGRLLQASDDWASDARANPVAVISYQLFQNRFSGNLSVVGKTIRLDGRAVIVAGVLPASFSLPSGEADVVVPFAWDSETQSNRDDHYLTVFCAPERRCVADPRRTGNEADCKTTGSRLSGEQ